MRRRLRYKERTSSAVEDDIVGGVETSMSGGGVGPGGVS